MIPSILRDTEHIYLLADRLTICTEEEAIRALVAAGVDRGEAHLIVMCHPIRLPNEFLLRKGRFCGGVRGGWVPVIKRPELDTAG